MKEKARKGLALGMVVSLLMGSVFGTVNPRTVVAAEDGEAEFAAEDGETEFAAEDRETEFAAEDEEAEFAAEDEEAVFESGEPSLEEESDQSPGDSEVILDAAEIVNVEDDESILEDGEIEDSYFPAENVELEEMTDQADSLEASTIGLNVLSHTAGEIQQKFKDSAVTLDDGVLYDTEPSSTAPYVLGKISSETKRSSLAMLNFVRYVAGLSDNVSWNTSHEENAQAAALLNAANNKLGHYQDRPEDMEEALYAKGDTGCRESNLGWGYATLNDAIVQGWMYDSDTGNREMVGHRRWILNPKMGTTAFGKVGRYTSMYAFDTSSSGAQNLVSWPAQQMPVEFIRGNNLAWSLSVGSNVNKSNVTVQLTRKEDGAVWIFSESSDASASDSGYFNVNNEGYGQTGCIIFQPNNISYKAGQEYEVVISGAISSDIHYTVSLFHLDMTLSATGAELGQHEAAVSVGKSVRLEASVLPYNATEKGLIWESEDTSIATVSASGVVTGGSKGSVRITVKPENGGASDSCQLTVSDIPVNGISLNKHTLSLDEGSTDSTLVATISPKDATNTTIEWESENPSIATVDEYGKITGVSKGIAAITVQTVDGGFSDSCSVEVYALDNWYKDYTFSKDDEAHTITLTEYNGSGAELVVPATTAIRNVNYATIMTGSVYYNKSGITSISIEDNVELSGNMSGCFRGCTGLKTLNIGSINTKNVTNMTSLFDGCSELNDLNLASFDTSATTDMTRMFAGCSGIKSLNLKSFNTHNVTNMYGMFWHCTGLKSLDLASFGTEKVTDMSYMFAECSSLEELNIKGFDTRTLGNMEAMFGGCSSLVQLDLSSFNTENVENIFYLFQDCAKLKSLDLSNFNTKKMDMGYVFSRCSSLETLNLSSFDFSGKDYSGVMFDGCDSLSEIQTPKVRNYAIRAWLPKEMYEKKSDGTWGNTRYTDMMDAPANTTIAVFSDFILTSSAGVGGTISPSGEKIMVKGGVQSYRIKANDGYKISDVLVDGKSVGAVGMYTFSKIDKDHTIAARFVKSVISVNKVTLSANRASISIGQTMTLRASVSPENASNKKITWKSSDSKIATVSSSGVVKGVKKGTATITATTVDGNKIAKCTITVKPISVKSVKLGKKTASVKKGKKLTLKATVSPSNATNKAVSWTSSNKKIATVSSKGVVKGVKKGKATITVTTKDGKKTASCKVTVK